ncbi:MAG: hypothetical protein K9L59_02260 [Desulfobacterales bacterium]|nr:hypothetical protein [Desulfobacterales bacterium]
MKMRVLVPEEGLQAIVHGTDTIGITLGRVPQQTYFAAGWHRLQFIDIAKEDTSIRLEFPSKGFFGVAVGSMYPLPENASYDGAEFEEMMNDYPKSGKESP